VGGAKIAFFRGKEFLKYGETDKEGTLTLHPLAAPARIAVILGHRLLVRSEMAAGPGKHTIRVPPGARVEGKIVVDGGLPDRPMKLKLTRDGPGRAEERVPLFLATALGIRLDLPETRKGTTASDGSFRFSDLPSDWSGKLLFPRGLTLEETGDDFLALSHPARALRIGLVRSPAIRGRIVDSAGAPVAKAEVEYELKAPTQVTGSSSYSGEDGRFRIPLTFGSLDQASMEIVASDVGSLSLEIHDVDGERGRDLGDLVLKPVRKIAFQVRDEKGKPVEGALARLAGKDRSSEPTDERGSGILDDAPLEPFPMTVDALGFQQAAVTVPAELEAPLEVTLSRSGRLEILIRDPAGDPVPGLYLVLSSTQPPFEGDQALRPDSILGELGASRAEASRSKRNPDGSWKSLGVTFRPDEDGRLLLSGLRPGIPLDLEAHQAVAGSPPVAALRGVTLGRGEWRRLVLEVPGPARILQGRIVDARGNPLNGSIEIWRRSEGEAIPDAGLGWGYNVANTDRQGRFRFERIYEDAVDLEARGRGFLPRVLRNQPVPRDGKEIEIVLDEGPGRTVRVQVAGPGGQPVAALEVLAKQGPFRLAMGRRQEDGRFLVEGLPAGRVELSAWIAGRAFSQTHDTADPEAILTVPASGSVKVRWIAPIPPDTSSLLELAPESAPEKSLGHRFPEKGEAPGSMTFPVVFPGTYRCRITLYSRRPGGEWIYPPETWTAPAAVTVQAGEEASVSIGPD